MELRHIRARFRSIVRNQPIQAEQDTGFSCKDVEYKNLRNPVFGSTLHDRCIKAGEQKLIEYIAQSIIISASKNPELRRRNFPTPYVIVKDSPDIITGEHMAICIKAKQYQSCMMYTYGFGKFDFSSLAFDRDEFAQYERVIGASILSNPITCKKVPSVVHLKTIVRLDGAHRKVHLADAMGVAKYFYDLGLNQQPKRVKMVPYFEEIMNSRYGVSKAAATACWKCVPNDRKAVGRDKGDETHDA